MCLWQGFVSSFVLPLGEVVIAFALALSSVRPCKSFANFVFAACVFTVCVVNCIFRCFFFVFGSEVSFGS